MDVVWIDQRRESRTQRRQREPDRPPVPPAIWPLRVFRKCYARAQAQKGEPLSRRAQLVTEVMTLNPLVRPASEHAMPDWIRRTALADILGTDFTALSDEALYRNLDQLDPQRPD